jgi:CheY-like chemotaxis protein
MDDWTQARTSWLREPKNDHYREHGLDARRVKEALERADLAYAKAATDETSRPCAVVAFRQDWARARAAKVLEEHGYDVHGCDDGADALGATAALCPDLLVCEEPLASVPTRELVEWTARLSPSTRAVVQVQHVEDVARAVGAGAVSAAPRSTSLEDLVRAALS